MWKKKGGGGGGGEGWKQPVCFRSVLKEHPFISPPILASVVTPTEAGEALSPRGLQRPTRASVPQNKCLSGPKDKVLEICPCDKKRRDP